MLHQESRGFQVAVVDDMTERCLADACNVMRVDVCPCGEQHQSNLEVSLFDGVVQRCAAELVERPGVRSGCEQRAHLREISFRRCEVQLLTQLPVVFRRRPCRHTA